MANNFFNDSNKAYSENLNDGILVGNAFDWTVDVSLPTDTDGVFPNSSTIVMAKVADVSITPNSNLSIGSTIENNGSSSQVYRLTVYPNFNRFGGFKSISLTADSGVTFYIANKGGTSPIASNLDYDDLDNVPELKVLKEYDIVITIPMNKEVTGLEFVFQSSGADVNGSISQSNVTGLSDSLTTLNTQVAGLINANDEIWNYDLTCSDYNPTIDSTVTVTCRVTDFYGVAVAGESVTLYCNGSSVSASITNNDGVASWTITLSDWNVHHFNVHNVSLDIKANGWKEVWINTSSNPKITVEKNANRCRLIFTGYTTNLTTAWTQYGSTAFLLDYAPKQAVHFSGADGTYEMYVQEDGKLYWKSSTGSSQTSRNLYGQYEWSIA